MWDGISDLGLVIDTYWFDRAGQDPADALRTAGSACRYLHLSHGDSRGPTYFGDGAIAMPAFLRSRATTIWAVLAEKLAPSDSTRSLS